MQKITNDLVSLAKELIKDDTKTKAASDFDKSWWNEFFKQFKRYVEKTNFVEYQVYFEIEGEPKWYISSPDDIELELKGFDVEVKHFDEKLKITDVFKNLDITKNVDVSPFLKRTPLQKKLENVLLKGMNLKTEVHINGEQFNSIGDDNTDFGTIDIEVEFEIKGKNIVIYSIDYDARKLEKEVFDYIMDKEEPKESDYPSRDDYRRSNVDNTIIASSLVKLAKELLAEIKTPWGKITKSDIKEVSDGVSWFTINNKRMLGITKQAANKYLSHNAMAFGEQEWIFKPSREKLYFFDDKTWMIPAYELRWHNEKLFKLPSNMNDEKLIEGLKKWNKKYYQKAIKKDDSNG